MTIDKVVENILQAGIFLPDHIKRTAIQLISTAATPDMSVPMATICYSHSVACSWDTTTQAVMVEIDEDGSLYLERKAKSPEVPGCERVLFSLWFYPEHTSAWDIRIVEAILLKWFLDLEMSQKP